MKSLATSQKLEMSAVSSPVVRVDEALNRVGHVDGLARVLRNVIGGPKRATFRNDRAASRSTRLADFACDVAEIAGVLVPRVFIGDRDGIAAYQR